MLNNNCCFTKSKVIRSQSRPQTQLKHMAQSRSKSSVSQKKSWRLQESLVKYTVNYGNQQTIDYTNIKDINVARDMILNAIQNTAFYIQKCWEFNIIMNKYEFTSEEVVKWLVRTYYYLSETDNMSSYTKTIKYYLLNLKLNLDNGYLFNSLSDIKLLATKTWSDLCQLNFTTIEQITLTQDQLIGFQLILNKFSTLYKLNQDYQKIQPKTLYQSSTKMNTGLFYYLIDEQYEYYKKSNEDCKKDLLNEQIQQLYKKFNFDQFDKNSDIRIKTIVENINYSGIQFNIKIDQCQLQQKKQILNEIIGLQNLNFKLCDSNIQFILLKNGNNQVFLQQVPQLFQIHFKMYENVFCYNFEQCKFQLQQCFDNTISDNNLFVQNVLDLSLIQCNLTDEDSQFVSYFINLQTLNLGYNNLVDINSILSSMKSLTILNLQNNYQLVHAEAISTLYRLEYLNISFTKVFQLQLNQLYNLKEFVLVNTIFYITKAEMPNLKNLQYLNNYCIATINRFKLETSYKLSKFQQDFIIRNIDSLKRDYYGKQMEIISFYDVLQYLKDGGNKSINKFVKKQNVLIDDELSITSNDITESQQDKTSCFVNFNRGFVRKVQLFEILNGKTSIEQNILDMHKHAISIEKNFKRQKDKTQQIKEKLDFLEKVTKYQTESMNKLIVFLQRKIERQQKRKLIKSAKRENKQQ